MMAKTKPVSQLAAEHQVSRKFVYQQGQKAKAALIFRLPDELEDEWSQLLEEIAENDNVTLAYRDDGGVQIFWTVPKED